MAHQHHRFVRRLETLECSNYAPTGGVCRFPSRMHRNLGTLHRALDDGLENIYQSLRTLLLREVVNDRRPGMTKPPRRNRCPSLRRSEPAGLFRQHTRVPETVDVAQMVGSSGQPFVGRHRRWVGRGARGAEPAFTQFLKNFSGRPGIGPNLSHPLGSITV